MKRTKRTQKKIRWYLKDGVEHFVDENNRVFYTCDSTYLVGHTEKFKQILKKAYENEKTF